MARGYSAREFYYEEPIIKFSSEEMAAQLSQFLMTFIMYLFQGLPTHDVAGKELSKCLLKKLEKLQIQQKAKYEEFLKSSGES